MLINSSQNMKKINLFYFARLKENLGISRETVDVPLEITNIQELVVWQSLRGELWRKEFKHDHNLRASINHMLVDGSAKVESGDEIAFFPPVTGG